MRILRQLAAAVIIGALTLALSAGFPTQAKAGINPLVIVFMENHGLAQVLADPVDMPYLNSLWNDPGSQQLTSYYAVDHPSFPNYSAFAAGKEETTGTGADLVKAGQFSDPTLWDQLTQAGISWGVFMESMPQTCSAVAYYNDKTSGADGPYKIGHNPAIPWSGVYGSAECQNVQPLSAMSASSLPAVSFVSPNLCNDMHGVPSSDTNGYQNCVTGTDSLEQRSDSWLQAHVHTWTAAGADVFVTFDEGSGNGNQVYGVLTGPGVQGGHVSTLTNHYGLLAGVEDAYGLPLLGQAAGALPIALPGINPAPPASNCPAPPAGSTELSGNVSLEAAQTGWTGTYTTNSKVTRVQPTGGSYDGLWALQLTNAASTAKTTGVNNANPLWVASSVAGATYTASGFVQGTPGTVLNLMLRETTPSGAGVAYHTTTVTLPDSGWHQITTAYTAKNAGDTIKYSLFASSLPASGTLLADCLDEHTP